MKVIVTYVSVGAGHFKAAKAVSNYLKQNYKDIDVKLVDALSQTNFLFRLTYNYGYIFLVKYAPLLWGLAFWVTYSKRLRGISRFYASLLYLVSAKRFTRLLIKENPDFIISTHFLTSHIAVALKLKRRLGSKITSVITDFGVHPFWVIPGTDLYIAASDFTKNMLISQGVKEEDIRVTGIPVEDKFSRKPELKELFNKLGLKQDKFIPLEKATETGRAPLTGFTVLIVTGSFGIGPIEDIIKILQGQDIQILVVCARNKRLYERLKRKNYPNCFVFGFVENIDELMAVSCVLITKPGGLSISEALSMDLFPIFISPIPGQETENIKALAYYGIGLRPKSVGRIKDIVLDLKLHPDKLKEIQEAMRRVKKPFSVRQVCDAVFESGGRAAR